MDWMITIVGGVAVILITYYVFGIGKKDNAKVNSIEGSDTASPHITNQGSIIAGGNVNISQSTDIKHAHSTYSSATPEEIKSNLRTLSPYARNSVTQDYRNQQVSWHVEFSSVLPPEDKKDHLHYIIMFYPPSQMLVSCYISDNKYPWIKTIKEGTRLIIKGKIENINPISYDIRLKNCELYLI
ncbi:MAG: hypothetical protein WC243_03635 [Patescibacteria group bacterium]|jgi:hypothetical protein